MSAHVYYVVQSEMLDGGVIESQVVSRLRAQSRYFEGDDTRLVFLEPARIALGAAVRATRKAFRRMWPGGRIKVVPFVSRAGTAAIGEGLALSLVRERLSSAPLVLHCRGGNATISADLARRRLGRGRVIYDLRGASLYELAHRFGSPFAEALPPEARRLCDAALGAERLAGRLADFTTTVSAGMRDYAVDVLGIPREKVVVTPSCVERLAFSDSARKRARAAWGVTGDAPIFVYAGRLGPERLPEHMFRVFRVAAAVRPDARLVLMLYRNDMTNLPAALHALGVRSEQVVTASCTRDDVMERLPGADVAFFFCEPALRFQCALPIKFAEYLSAGLRIVVNSVATEVAEIVRTRRVGWVVDHDCTDAELQERVTKIVTELEAERAGGRSRALDCCSELFMWERYFPALRRAYALDGQAAPALAAAE